MSEQRPAVGTRAEPAPWRRAVKGAAVALHRRAFEDSRWSFLYGQDTRYAREGGHDGAVQAAAWRMRGGPTPGPVHGPVIQAPVWTWEIPLYFWFGGIAAGSSFAAAACDLAGDRRSAAVARKVSLGAASACAPLLVGDLGRPGRFLHMLRIVKPRSPMSMGAWCLTLFSGLATAAVAADLLGRPRAGRAFGATSAVAGGYLGSYTGVLLASTAVPVWARSKMLLGPIFLCTAVANGAAATRLSLGAGGVRAGHLAREALGTVETGAITVELVLAGVNERRLGELARPFRRGPATRLYRAARWASVGGLALRRAHRVSSAAHDAASLLFLAGGLALRYAWLAAGKDSARDHAAVAGAARARSTG
jgi:Polysulphide reductase, NrfD